MSGPGSSAAPRWSRSSSSPSSAKATCSSKGAPGLGKTSLAKAWAEFFGLEFRRIQFTPDLMPLDVIGSNIIQTLDGGERAYRFYKGPIFANMVLGDEINRATPKTQSAFLEAMEEKRITFLGEVHELPSPFFVIATQNPIELEGTYPLPEAQMDRFLMRLFFAMPDFAALKAILDATERGGIGIPAGREATEAVLAAYRRAAKAILVPEELRNFIVRLVAQTHPEHTDVEAVKKYVRFGASPRCALGLLKAARARAVVAGQAPRLLRGCRGALQGSGQPPRHPELRGRDRWRRHRPRSWKRCSPRSARNTGAWHDPHRSRVRLPRADLPAPHAAEASRRGLGGPGSHVQARGFLLRSEEHPGVRSR